MVGHRPEPLLGLPLRHGPSPRPTQRVSPSNGRQSAGDLRAVGGTSSDSNVVHSTNDFSGFGLTPSVIDSGYGAVRVLGFPTLEGFSKEQLDSEVNVAKAQEYLSTATFQDMRFNPLTMYREV